VNNWFHLSRLVKANIISGSLLLGMLVINLIWDIPFNFSVIIVALIGYFVIQSVVIHFNYVLRDKNTSVEIENDKIQVVQMGQSRTVHLNDIHRVELIGRFFKDHYSWIPVQKYYYTKFYLNEENSEPICLSCLILSREKLYGFHKDVKLINTSFPFIGLDD